MKVNIGLAITRVFWRYSWWAFAAFLFMMIPLHFLGGEEVIEIFSAVYLALLLAFYGYTRIRRFHPIFNKDYLTQLAMSPWNVNKRLPRGSVHLFWADAIILAFFTLLTLWLPGHRWTIPLFAFMVGHIIGLYDSFCKTDQVRFVFLYALFAPLAIYPHFNVIISFVVLIALIAIGYYGVYCYLKEFPWNTPWWNENQIKTLKQKAIRRRVIQWPFHFLCVEETLSITFAASVMIALIVFWWLYVIEWIAINSGGEPLPYESYFFVINLIVFRFFIYFFRSLPPISLLGRLRTGRFIIPGYDKIFIAPIIMLLTAILAPIILKALGVPLNIAFALSFSLVFFGGLVLPPSLENMQYSSKSRLPKPIGKPTRTLKYGQQIPAILNHIIKSP